MTKKTTVKLKLFKPARSCIDDPPMAWLGIDMDWPLKKKVLGTIVTYNCPFRTKTNLEELAGKGGIITV